jgi:hypothetical protein
MSKTLEQVAKTLVRHVRERHAVDCVDAPIDGHR